MTINEATETSYDTADHRPAARLGRRGEAPAGTDAGLGGTLQADQEAGHTAPGRRCAGLVPKTGAGLPDQDQSGAAEVDDGREEEIGGVGSVPGLEDREGHPITYLPEKCATRLVSLSHFGPALFRAA